MTKENKPMSDTTAKKPGLDFDEQDLLELYRRIMRSRVYTPAPSLWERLKKLLSFDPS